MPRPKSLIPKLCVDKSRNRAFCKVNGKFVSLGPAGTAEAQQAYGTLLANLAQGKALEAAKAQAPAVQNVVTLNDVLIRFYEAQRLAQNIYGIRTTLSFGRYIYKKSHGDHGLFDLVWREVKQLGQPDLRYFRPTLRSRLPSD